MPGKLAFICFRFKRNYKIMFTCYFQEMIKKVTLKRTEVTAGECLSRLICRYPCLNVAMSLLITKCVINVILYASELSNKYFYLDSFVLQYLLILPFDIFYHCIQFTINEKYIILWLHYKTFISNVWDVFTTTAQMLAMHL